MSGYPNCEKRKSAFETGHMKHRRPHFIIVVGARPNYMKAAPIVREFEKQGVKPLVVHTGQHYSRRLSSDLLRDVGIRPDINLQVGSGSHAEQTAKVLTRFERLLIKRRPNLVIVVGDVNSTLACSLASVKLGVPVAHIEAGLRSFDRSMPEEINRLVTDRISDILFTTSQAASRQLVREGVASQNIHFVGNVMIDTLFHTLKRVRDWTVCEKFQVKTRHYALLTLHRPSNVDSPSTSSGLIRALRCIASEIPILFPVHPRTTAMFKQHGLLTGLKRVPNLKLTEPIRYLHFTTLLRDARFVMTDSGGIQEETTAMGIPCLTLRNNTERPMTVTSGTNRIVGQNPDRIVSAARSILKRSKMPRRVPAKWDGRAAHRIIRILKRYYRF